MSEIIKLQNGDAVCQISTKGAELLSFEVAGEEKIYQGKEGFWAGSAPVLFPICGRLVGGFYTYDGNRYETKAHGFLKSSNFTVVNQEKSTATFLLESNEETLKEYPFEFKFRIMYKLSECSLGIYFIIENHSSTPMYYSVGCHEGYALKGDLSEYYISFEEDENEVYHNLLIDNFTTTQKIKIPLSGNLLKLTDYFKKENDGDSMVIYPVKSKRVTLKRGDEEELSVYYKDFESLVLWTQYGAPFICIEPWNGMPDAVDTDHSIENKVAIKKLEPNASTTLYHNITIE